MKSISQFINVVFPIPANRVFCYSVPESLRAQVGIGTRVLAPFGNRDSVGFVTDKIDKTEIQNIKEIKKILDVQPLISPSLFKLARWMSDYYACSLGESLDTILPHRYRPSRVKKKS